MKENFCCFLSEGDVESDFNWFASVILFHFALFLLSVIYRVIFERRSMKVASAMEKESASGLGQWIAERHLTCSSNDEVKGWNILERLHKAQNMRGI